MFAKLLTMASIAILAVATPTPGGGGGSVSGSCSTGPIQCCNTVQKASDPAAAGILALLGIVLQSVDVAVGLSCSPITVIGVGNGGSCNANAVCCEDNSHGGIISIGCVPVTL
ncbi:fungal hydrophobin [Lentinus tigrinus ALCF2SS1-7]|uniref:Hydrophobin n=1 Tax=Lentinus tigrinus ALCF2SS1-6 TaxID=1328759 RepID=A0A5C2RSG4_9APHY|nr:fungal hydrophobin [Lentinus tigrinus ALCF2SS1-6]RPD68820.1 fungal hydrophobin [Lentinus tigrinus ALCF2SS1-7]